MEEHVIIKRPVATEQTRTPQVAIQKYEEIMEKTGEDLIAYVQQAIDLMDKGIFFNGKRMPSQFELTMSLVTYEHIWNSLVMMYEVARTDSEKASEAYNIWLAHRYMDVRDEKNNSSVAASKYLSTTEIGYEVISRFPGERNVLLAEKSKADAQLSTMRHLLDGWKSFRWTLSDLTKISNADERLAQGFKNDPTEEMADMASQALDLSEDDL